MGNRKKIDKAGALYHIYNRGVNKQDIYKDHNDIKFFNSRCKECTSKFNLEIHAICEMTNHYHMLIETHEENLSKAMKYLGESYSKYFLKKYSNERKVGHTFQGPYGRKMVFDEEYLQSLISYIHLNPVKARLVAKPEDYLWSSYNQYLTGKKTYDFINQEKLQKHFSAFNIDSNKSKILVDDWEPEIYYHRDYGLLENKKINVIELEQLISKYQLKKGDQRRLKAYCYHNWLDLNSSEVGSLLKIHPNTIRFLKHQFSKSLLVENSKESLMIKDIKHLLQID